MSAQKPLIVKNGEAWPVEIIPLMPFDNFASAVLDEIAGGGRIVSMFAAPGNGARPVIYAALARDKSSDIAVLACQPGAQYRSLTPDAPQAHMFEREIYETWGIKPEGHPWLKPVRFPGKSGGRNVGVADFFRVEGEEVHEVAVGPVHAGVIEPGHFRFQCHGEKVFHLEISLGYQHRGVEASLSGGPDKTALARMETVAGDTTIGHATAYCQLVEGLMGVTAPDRGGAIRAMALEMERLANHTGDLGMLSQDIGYLPPSAFLGRLRGDFLNLTQVICGNRFGRGLVIPGGVRFGLDEKMTADVLGGLNKPGKEAMSAARLLWNKPSVLARFENTGTVSLKDCEALGLVGPTARACGADRDARRDHPVGAYASKPVTVANWGSGDVFARAMVRLLEMKNSLAYLTTLLNESPAGALTTPVGAIKPHHMAISLVEGWRGEICHAAITGPDGRFSCYKVADPSFHNWTGLAMALRGQEISDFPLCNKSFNLSYCGFDL